MTKTRDEVIAALIQGATGQDPTTLLYVHAGDLLLALQPEPPADAHANESAVN